jgi:hypothetical protein
MALMTARGWRIIDSPLRQEMMRMSTPTVQQDGFKSGLRGPAGNPESGCRAGPAWLS